MIKLLNIDCMEYMKGLEDNVFDLCITSPPYNLGDIHHTGNKRKKHYSDNMLENKYQESQILLLNELRRVIKPEGSLIYNHKNRIRSGLTISPLIWIFKSKWQFKQEIVWRNGSQNFDKIRAFPMSERFYWLANSDVKMDNSSSLKDCMLESDWPPQGTLKAHGRSFPLKMVDQFISCFKGSLKMFDPYLGSGTSAIAAHYGNIEFVGCELDKDYFKAAQERFKKETAQLDIFGKANNKCN